MRILMITLLVIGMSVIGTSYGQTSEGDCYNASFEYFSYPITEDYLEVSEGLFASNEQRGCCSHHGGVCGCSGGRKKCCDGSLSPSCTCHHDDELQVFYQ